MEDNVTLVLVYCAGVAALCFMYQNPDEFDLTRFQIALIIIFWPLVMIYVWVCLMHIIGKSIFAFISS